MSLFEQLVYVWRVQGVKVSQQAHREEEASVLEARLLRLVVHYPVARMHTVFLHRGSNAQRGSDSVVELRPLDECVLFLGLTCFVLLKLNRQDLLLVALEQKASLVDLGH